MQLSNHLFEELAMDVYDEVDRRETDAGEVKLSSKICVALHPEKTFAAASLLTLIRQNLWSHSHPIICSVAGYSEPQHPGDGDDCGAFPSCESRVFINAKPGKSALQNSHANTLLFG